jgi:choline dehydrogenase-like flavoprotein
VILDGRNVEGGSQLETDVCIMGGGAAGITLARELSGRAFRVCLLESGGFVYDADTESLNKGDFSAFVGHEDYYGRMRFFGGSTNHWEGRCRPLEETDFLARDWVPYSGWPFDRSHLDAYYLKAAEICGLGSSEFSPGIIEEATGHAPLELDASTIRPMAFQFSKSPRFGVVYRAELENSDNVTVLLNSNVVGFETGENVRRVNNVNVKCLQGSGYRVSARYYVLACGGIENARLLMMPTRYREGGLGNEHGLVGRFFMEHPGMLAAIWLPSEPDIDLHFYSEHHDSTGRGVSSMGWMALTRQAVERERIANYTAWPYRGKGWHYLDGEASLDTIIDNLRDFELPDDFSKHLRNVARDFDYILDRKIFRLRKKFQDLPPPEYIGLITSTEVVPNPDSRLVLIEDRDILGLNRVRLDLQFGDLDWKTIQKGTELVGGGLARAGLGRIKFVGKPKFLNSGRGHHMGTTRMHADPRAGVVDPDCRLHSVSNLYIAGSSVFPTSGSGVPTMTIVALAVRLADHITGLMG